MVILLAATLMVQHCLDPDDTDPYNKRLLDSGGTCRKYEKTSSSRLAAPRAVPLPIQLAIKRHFDAQLLDGPSARWLWPKQRKSTDTYCGWVNAKNRMGAYTGWKPYWVSIKGPSKVESGYIVGDGDSRIVLETICPALGYNIDDPPTG